MSYKGSLHSLRPSAILASFQQLQVLRCHDDASETSTLCTTYVVMAVGAVKSSYWIVECILEAASMTSVWKKFYDCSCQRRRCRQL